MSFIVPDAALDELKSYRATLLGAVGAHLISQETAKAQYWERVRRVISQAWTQTENDRNFPIKCGHCYRVTVVANDVKQFECVCSPHVVQYTFQCRNLGESAEDMIRRVKPSATFG